MLKFESNIILDVVQNFNKCMIWTGSMNRIVLFFQMIKLYWALVSYTGTFLFFLILYSWKIHLHSDENMCAHHNDKYFGMKLLDFLLLILSNKLAFCCTPFYDEEFSIQHGIEAWASKHRPCCGENFSLSPLGCSIGSCNMSGCHHYKFSDDNKGTIGSFHMFHTEFQGDNCRNTKGQCSLCFFFGDSPEWNVPPSEMIYVGISWLYGCEILLTVWTLSWRNWWCCECNPGIIVEIIKVEHEVETVHWLEFDCLVKLRHSGCW